MSIFSSFDNTIKKYGSTVTIWNGKDKKVTKAFIQPTNYNTRSYYGGDYKPPQYVSDNNYLYVGSIKDRIESSSTVIVQGDTSYSVKRSQPYCVGDTYMYLWAIITPFNDTQEESNGD